MVRGGFRVLSAVSPGLAARAAARLWFRIPRPRIGDSARAFLSTGTPIDLTAGGCRVAAWRWGTGRPVILVHGWGGHSAQFQAIIAGLTDRDFQAIAFDAPSHGLSGPGALGANYATLFEFADVLRAVARDVPDVAGIVAHSGGCAAVAWALSQDATLRPARLVFVAPFARALRYMKLFQRELGLNHRTLDRFRADTERQFGFRWVDLEVPEVADRIATPPVLVVHDKEDRETSWQDGADIAAKWPGAELKTTSGLGHNRILRDPDVVRSVVDYLRA